ncbi:50S ribosomal protein L18e [Sulfurisphaera javensis]|uniref:Large ribosomal subunit protein eL18 n=1 Tax=Sulfurisphaera javensis TaxID=2049879 RepID=A0AAT9GP95_9CREN
MVARTGSTNIMIRKLIDLLDKQEKPLWQKVAEELQKPSRKRAYINIYKINKYTKSNDIVIVPGKVLGIGNLDHPVTVVALSFSKSAKEKIEKSGGKVMSLYKAVEEIKDFKNVRLMKQ